MGAGASAYDGSGDDIPKDIQESYEQCDEIKQNIAVKDAQFIHGQSIHKWKDHTHLIALLSERTKSQLIRAAKVFPEYDGVGLNVNDGVSESQATKSLERKLHSMLGGTPYAEFMKDCVMCPEAVDVELLADTLNYLGTNEYLLAEIFCTSTTEELQRTSALFEVETKYKLLDRVLKKTNNDSAFQKFIQLILTVPRNVNNEVARAETDVSPLVEMLHTSGLGSDDERDDDRIFQILGKASRTECQQMETVFKNTYQIDLHEAIRAKYKGSIALALVLWTEGHINDAIAQRIEHNLQTSVSKSTNANGEASKSQVDIRMLSHIFARYDHWQLVLIADSYQQIFSKDMIAIVDDKLTGKCKRAVTAWITNGKTCDDGYERKVFEFLRDNSGNNYAPLLTDDAKKDELRALLKSQYDHLVTYAESHHIHMPPSITRKSVAESDTTTGATKETAKATVSYEENFAMVREYLLEMIKIEDYDNSGVLDDNDLWLILTDMELGYTEEEMTAFSGWVDIDSDGQIDYNEILVELTDDVVQVIQDVGHLTVTEKLAHLRQQRESKFKQLNISLNEGGHVTTSSETTSTPLPPSLMDFLKDTFNEVDVDHSGTLNHQELTNILHTVLANSDGDKELLNIEWDKDHDGAVSWDEASKAFADIFNKYINSKNDYWIALVDKTNGHFFWYNVSDANSFWMTEEDQAKYQAHSHEEHLVPSKIPRKETSGGSGSSKEVSSYQEMRRLQKQKFDAVKDKHT